MTLIKKQIIKRSLRSNARAISLLLCVLVLMMSVSVTFAWFGSTYEDLNTVITMGKYSADISVYSEDGTLIDNKSAENGENISFDNIRRMGGWAAGDVSVYYIYTDNTGEIDMTAYLSFISSFTTADKNDESDYSYARKHFSYLVTDITKSATENGGFTTFIKENNLPSAEHIAKNGKSFADKNNKVSIGEIKAGKNACFAVYFCCYDLPDKLANSIYSFSFKTSVTTAQSGAPTVADSTVSNSAENQQSATVAATTKAEVKKTTENTKTTAQKPTTASKADWEWQYSDSSHKTVTLTKYNGKAKSVIIPSLADGMLVNALGNNLFADSAVEKAVVPATITDFECYTFYSSKLKSIEIQSKTRVNDIVYTSPYTTDGKAIYTADMTALVRYLTQNTESKFTLPADVTYIYDNAFRGCKNLKTLVMNNVDYLSASTFEVSSITNYYLCSNKPVTAVGVNVFGNAKNVSIHILSDMSSAYKNAAATKGYKVVNDITINPYENYPYTTISGTNYIIVKNGSEYMNTKYTSDYDEFVIITGYTSVPEDGVLEIPETIICDGKPYKVVAVADNAFSGCKELKQVILPSHKVTCATNSFAKCDNLKVIQYGEN